DCMVSAKRAEVPMTTSPWNTCGDAYTSLPDWVVSTVRQSTLPVPASSATTDGEPTRATATYTRPLAYAADPLTGPSRAVVHSGLPVASSSATANPPPLAAKTRPAAITGVPLKSPEVESKRQAWCSSAPAAGAPAAVRVLAPSAP